MKSLRSPLARAKGLGTSNTASEYFWLQTISAVALIPLILWLCLSLAFLPNASYETLVAWLQSPINAVLLILVLVVSFQHAQMGMQVIIEDYVSQYGFRISGILATKFICYFMMVLGVFSIIKISLGS